MEIKPSMPENKPASWPEQSQLEENTEDTPKMTADEMLSQTENLHNAGHLKDGEYAFLFKKIAASRTNPTFDNTTMIQRILKRRTKETLTNH